MNAKSKITNIKKVVSVLLIFILATCFMNGCRDSTEDISGETVYENVVFIGVQQSNQTDPTFKNEKISKMVYQTAYAYGNVYQISADGEPRVVIDAPFTEPDIRIDDQRRRLEAKNNRDLIIEALPKSEAVASECNTLDALRMAAGKIHSNGGSGVLIVHNSGITTTGDLNFATTDLIHTDSEHIVEELEDRHAIPDLSGIEVIWYGMGSVSYPQEKLSTEYAYNLRNIWESILDKAGADYDIDQTEYSREEEKSGLPSVSTMPVISRDPIGEEGAMSNVIRFDEDTTAVNFHKENADFIDKSAAVKALEPVAKYLIANPDKSVELIGSTASIGSEENCLALSERRAKACASLLTEYGVKEKQIKTRGIGREQSPLRVNDLDSEGNLVEDLAKKNRAVFAVFNQSV